ncbi:DUF2142 domain-containing protein [Acidocella sp.]|uniref:DUF2142 domain-containing protein n=1 Tax=Acidocella sp. TaxID=50710 RepID=UPI00261585BF|nr:DUF2142 domain-containing protein [Acidocella sp.]
MTGGGMADGGAGWRGWAERYCGKAAIMAVFLLCALPGTILTALLTPPGQSPDEVTHYARALGLLHGVILGVRHEDTDPLTGRPEWQTGLKVDTGDFRLAFGAVTQVDQRPVETFDDWNTIERSPQDPDLLYVGLPNTATYFPAAYVPGALGAAMAKYIFNETPLHVFITARIFMAVAFMAVGLGTLYVAAYGEALLVSVLLLPMTVFLAGTLNQDGLLIAMTCLAASCLTRAARGWRIAGLVVFALVLGAKPPYILLLGVFALPLFAPGFWRRLTDMALALLPVLGWIGLISLLVVVPYGKAQYFPGPLYAGNHAVLMDHANAGAQLHILMERPRRFLALPYYSLMRDSYSNFITMIGVLGPLQIVMPHGYYAIWGVCLALTLLGLLVTRRPYDVPPGMALVNFIAVGAAVGVTLWGLYIIFYLDWTNVGLPDIDGIQGRYLLIFLPFALFAIPHLQSFPGLRHVRFALPPLLLALPSLGMAVFDIGYIPLKLVLNYYLH